VVQGKLLPDKMLPVDANNVAPAIISVGVQNQISLAATKAQ
jgi:hypothetical protein